MREHCVFALFRSVEKETSMELAKQINTVQSSLHLINSDDNKHHHHHNIHQQQQHNHLRDTPQNEMLIMQHTAPLTLSAPLTTAHAAGDVPVTHQYTQTAPALSKSVTARSSSSRQKLNNRLSSLCSLTDTVSRY